ncbi:uncharacterized protein LOC133206006 [Saccostrea echinata]|uniref:uncharacterized protein LOC133206006 n=1 Tax=Saccostrea echinata TaxID=191078 RepID=UPI002A807C5C|nr:uncharacterized protein LOC133206006 [Saccostrea echinata]
MSEAFLSISIMNQLLKAVEYLDSLVRPTFTDAILQMVWHLLLRVLNSLQEFTSGALHSIMHISLKLLGAALTEVSIQLIIIYVGKLENKNVIVDEKVSKSNMSIQTSGPWQKKIRSKERVYSELLDLFSNKTSILKRRRRALLRKGKLRVNYLEKEYSGKKKLLSGVCHRLVNIGIHVDHLTHRMREKRLQLENRRLQNKQVVERYEELNQHLNSYLNIVLNNDQGQNEEVHSEIPTM